MTDNRRGSTMRFLLRAQTGAIGGLFAAVAVAVVFFAVGAMHLHPLAVPVNLASGLFGDTNQASGGLSQLDADVIIGVEVLAYTALHLLVFAVVGAGAVFVLRGASFWSNVLGGAVYGGVAYTSLRYLIGWIADTPLALDLLGLPRVLLVNGLAGTIIGAFLYLAEHGA